MTQWTDMTPAEFDRSAAGDRKAREFIATAAGTLFPRLMPEIPRRAPGAREPMPGEVPLFGGEEI